MKVYKDKIADRKQTPILQHRLVSWITIMLVGITIEAYFRDNLYSLGLSIIELSQNYINENYLLINLLRMLSFMASKDLCLIAVVISFNYFDMYSALVVSEIVACCGIGTGLFKLIYKNPRPFFHEDWVKVYDCETGYGNPSGHSIIVLALYLTFWKIFKLNYQINRKLKKLLFSLLCVFISLVLFSRLALGVHSLNQIILGSFFGYQIYSLMFYVFNITLDIDEEVKSLVNFRIWNILAISTISLLCFGFILFNFFPISMSLEMDKYLVKILESCPGTPYSKTFDYEAYIMLSTCSILLGAYWGIYYDIKVNLNNFHEDWVEINKGHLLWNKTSFFKGVMRLMIMAIILFIPLAFNVFISSHAHTNIVFILKNLIPYFATSFCLFAFVRKTCSTLKFTNHLTKEKQN